MKHEDKTKTGILLVKTPTLANVYFENRGETACRSTDENSDSENDG